MNGVLRSTGRSVLLAKERGELGSSIEEKNIRGAVLLPQENKGMEIRSRVFLR